MGVTNGTEIAIGRRAFLSLAGAAGLALLAGCGSSGGAASSAASGASSASGASTGAAARAITVGTLATEDILPFWVAESESLFADRGLQVSIVPFQSATELISGVSSGEVDLAMTDIMVSASIFASGVDVRMLWVTLGASADQGRFGIMAGPDSDVASLQDLAGVPIGVGSNTILEYVMDALLEDAGVPAGQVQVAELQKLPVRYQAMLSGEVAAAALPGTLLALGEANGCKLIADDTAGRNLSQSVMIAQSSLADDAGAAELLKALQEVWDEAAGLINADSEAYRSLLVDKANLPAEIAQSYPMSSYPKAALPTSAMVQPVLEWMQQKGYLTKSLSYDEATGAFVLN